MYGTFHTCTNLTEVPIIPNKVKDMTQAFNSTAIANAPEIPGSVELMNSTFENCQNLIGTVEIPENVISLNSAFRNCQNLEVAKYISNNVENMNQTFSNCIKLTEVTNLPDNSIDMSFCFYNCTECTCESNILNTEFNIYNSEIKKYTSSLNKNDGNFYATDNIYNFIGCIYKPMMRTFQSASSCTGGYYFFSGCLLSCEDIATSIVVNDFYRINADNIQIGNRGKNTIVLGCVFDKRTLDLMGLSSEDYYLAPNNLIQNHSATYVYMDDSLSTLDLTDYIKSGVRTFRVNSAGTKEHTMILPSTENNYYYSVQLNLNLVLAPFKINMIGASKDIWITNVYSNTTIYIYTDTSSFYIMSGTQASGRLSSDMPESNFTRATSGQSMWHSTTNKQIYKSSSGSWLDATGNKYDAIHSGSTSSRPATTEGGSRTPIIREGFFYMDTTLNKPIWWTGSSWVDATGATV